ncbi:MAG: hypothetical protein IJY97_00730 [Clostridia bacterium]|nr:hypothetical protein [Clostridia bacterium]
MKTAYRLLALALVAITLLGSFAACTDTKDPVTDETTASNASTEAPAATTEAEATTESPYDENGYLKSSLPDELDFGGAEVTVLWWNDVEQPEFFVENTNGELINDAIWQRNANVEAKMGVKLNWIDIKGQYNSDGENYANYVGNAYASGSDQFDLMSAHSRTMALTAMYGYCAELTKLDHLDFEKPWWPAVMLDTATINNKLYFVTGDVSTNSIHQMYVMFYNKDMLKNYAELIEPSQHVDDGNWTMETMMAMTSGIYNDLNNNQKADKDDTFGFTSLNWHFDAIYYGCGMTMLEKDTDPAKLLKVADDWTSEKAITLSDTVGGWIKKGDAYLDSSNYANIFVNGRALLVMARHHDIASIISKAGFKYGIVPMPKYDKDQEKHITCVGNPVSLYSIYTLSKDANRAAAVLECWASEAYRTTTPAVFENTFKLRLSESSTESRMYDLIRSGVTFDLCRFFNRQLSSMGSEWYKCATTAGNWASTSERLLKAIPAKLQDIADSFNKIGN